MAKRTKPLTDTEIKAAKPKDADYQLYDGDGLTLLIKSSGSKLWQFRYHRPLTKQRTKQSFGAYPAVSLSDACKLRAESRALLVKEIDPQEHQKELARNTWKQRPTRSNLSLNVGGTSRKPALQKTTPKISGVHWKEMFFLQLAI